MPTPATSRRRAAVPLATVVAVVSLGFFALAAWFGWLGLDVGAGDQFCEAARDGLLRQPANSLSNLGFVLAGILIAFAADRLPPGHSMPHPLATTYAVVVVLLGPGSMAMHATGTDLGGRLDTLSMYLIAGFAAAYAISRRARRRTAVFTRVLLLTVAVGVALGRGTGSLPVVMSWGNLWFGLLLITALVLELQRPSGSTRWAWSACAAMLIAFAIWNLSKTGHPWCDPHSWLQGHAIWHLLCALAAYLMFEYYRSESPRMAAITPSSRPG